MVCAKRRGKTDPGLDVCVCGGGREGGGEYVLCFAWSLLCFPDGWGSRGVSAGSVPGGKSIRAPGGGDEPHSAIW